MPLTEFTAQATRHLEVIRRLRSVKLREASEEGKQHKASSDYAQLSAIFIKFET